MKISVIIPTFNRASTIERALDSVRAQTLRVHELIVVDDGSTDQTARKTEDWAIRHGFAVRYLRQKNLGVSRARNYGVENATGDWLAFLDSDDEWLPQKLAKQILLAPLYRLVHGEEIWIRNGARVNAMKKHAKTGGRIFTRAVDLCCISPSSVLMERALFDELGGFREDFPVCEDYDLWLKVTSRYDVGFIETPVLVKYGGHDDQLSRQHKAMDFFRVKALLPYLESKDLSLADLEHVARSIVEKCEILLKGYIKYSNLEHFAEVQAWRNEARSVLTANQSAHSVADLRPRSD